MRTLIVAGLLLAGLLASGCVGRWTHKQTQEELAASRKEQKATAAKLQAAERRLGELQQALNAAREAKEASEAAVREREDRLRALREQLTAATREAEEAKVLTQQERDRAERATQALEERIQRLELDQAAARAALEAARKDQEGAQAGRQQLEEQVQALRGQVQTLSVAAERSAQQLMEREQELARAAAAPASGPVVATASPDGTVSFSIVASLLFKSGDSRIAPEGRAILARVAAQLAEAGAAAIRVEGHTDNKPLKASLQGKYRSNWELSAARATSVVRYLVLEGGIAPERLSAVGYADTRPVADNATEEGRQQNRRIEIVLYPAEAPSSTHSATR